MKLREWSYEHGDSGGWVEVEYPDEIIQEFMDFMLNNRQWPEQLEIMYNRFLKLRRDLTDAKNEAALGAAAQEGSQLCTAVTKAGTACKNTMAVEDGLCAIHRRKLVAA